MELRWDDKKSEKLKRERGFGFSEITALFEKAYHGAPSDGWATN